MAVNADDRDLDFKRDSRIDPMALDSEWLGLASLAGRYAEAAAQAVLEKDRAEKNRDIVYASLDNEVRTSPTMWPKAFGGDKKPSEDAIKNWIALRADYQEALDAAHQARYRAKLAAAGVRAMDTKDRSLEWLTKLFFNGYFVGPKIPKELDRQFLRDAAAAQTEEAQRRSLQRRRRKKGDGDE